MARTRSPLAIIAILTLAACASQEELITKDVEQAVRDFIDVRELQSVSEIPSANRDSWEAIDQNFILYKTRKQTYLVEFVRRCRELDEYPVVPDVRTTPNKIYTRFETIRGCRIANAFALSEGELAEVEALGESPGSRN
ncbi:MAG: DUF6491 family protein [Woeseiaceae bacterium]